MDTTSNIEMKNNIAADKKKLLTEKNKKLIFYIIMFAPLILQVAIFYVYVNISNIGLAFTEYSRPNGVLKSEFVWFKNFSFVLKYLFSPENSVMFGDTFMMYAVVLLIAMPIGILFSYYIYKKFPLSEVFRVVLFLPQVISGVTMTIIYLTLTNDVVMKLTGIANGLWGGYGSTVTYITIIFYTLWMSFGGNILLYCGAMSGVNDSMVEACHLDGCNVIKEFFYIILPSIYPTIVTFVLIDICSIFTQNMNLYTFFGQKDLPEGINGSIGYFITKQTAQTSYMTNYGWWNYSQLSALGLMITLVTVPFSLIVRHFMEKYGPSED